MTTADEFKAKGNAALQAGNPSEAVEFYTKAINADGSNHVYYSNRSAAYLQMGDGNNALDDAVSCLGLNPEFPKGYSRKGAALHALKRYNDSVAAYKEGLSKFPSDAGLTKGLEQVQKEKDGGGGSSSSGGGGGGMPGGAGGLFGPQMMAQMALDPRLRPFLADQEVMSKISMVQNNPNMLPTMLQDPKMMQLLTLIMGGGGGTGDDGGDGEEEAKFPSSSSSPASASAAPAPAAPSKKEESSSSSAPMQVEKEEKEKEPEVEEDLSDLPPEERKKKEDQRAAVKKKEQGNELYKSKQFEKALEAYDEAVALDPTNMTFLSNKAAVLFTQKKYQECIDQCLAAVEVGKQNRAPFEDRGKAYTRAAKAHQKLGNLAEAIEMCKEAQLENYDKATQRLLKTLELEKKKADALAYQDETKADEAKQRGNDHFRAREWGPAVQEYEEAVKRAPKNAAIRNNLSAALCKIMDFGGAQRQIEVALELDPQYVKAWARKGDIEMYMKEFHKAMESYKKGLELDSDNASCKEGLRKCMAAVSYGRQNMTEQEKKEQAAHAMADPEIQAILQDPVVQTVLRDFNENPAAAQQAMSNPGIRGKIEKLIAAGIIETR